MAHKILIVEDDPSYGLVIKNWCQKNEYEALLVTSAKQAKKAISDNSFDLVLTDLRLPDGDGIMLLGWIREQKFPIPVIIMTSYAEIPSAVAAMKLGASDYLEKPVNPVFLKEKIDQILEQTPASLTPKTIKSTKSSSDMVYGKCESSRKMHQLIELVAPTKMSVLILGESGTGKEYIARLIHDGSPRHASPFIAVDCGSLSKDLAPSELFGHLKGSFTSAISDKKGVFEQASGGTVFLDEIGNLPYEVQIQLLRTLQEQKVRPVGSATDIKVDVRIVAATNENLQEAITKNLFREDLYHRLNEFTIEVPSLRERAEDIPSYADFFLQQANEELGKAIKGISKKAIHILQNHHWSGNLRELRNVIRRAALFAQTDEIIPDNLPFLTNDLPPEKEETTSFTDNEPDRIRIALKKAGGNKTMAAKMLNIDRKTLYNKMHQYGINF